MPKVNLTKTQERKERIKKIINYAKADGVLKKEMYEELGLSSTGFGKNKLIQELSLWKKSGNLWISFTHRKKPGKIFCYNNMTRGLSNGIFLDVSNLHICWM